MSRKNTRKKPLKRTRTTKQNHLPLIIAVIAGIAVAAAVLIGVYFIFIKKDKNETEELAQPEKNVTATVKETELNTEKDTAETEPVTESSSESGTESDTELTTETQTESETEQPYHSEITELIQSMSLEQKVNQLFLVTPLALLNTTHSDITCVTQVGETTKAVYADNPVGGILLSRNNLEWTDDTFTQYNLENFRIFTTDFNDLSIATLNVPLLSFIYANELLAVQIPEITSAANVDDSLLKNYGISAVITSGSADANAETFTLTNNDGTSDALNIIGSFMEGYADTTAGTYETKAATQLLYLQQNATDSYPMLIDGIASVSDPEAVKTGIREEAKYRDLLISCPIDSSSGTDAGTQAVNLLRVGADMLLCENAADYIAARDAILSSIQSGGALSEQDINLSVMRILTAKFKFADYETASVQPETSGETANNVTVSVEPLEQTDQTEQTDSTIEPSNNVVVVYK